MGLGMIFLFHSKVNVLKEFSPSLFEKLLWDSYAQNEKRLLSHPALSLAEVKRSVARDVEHLLNTRRGYRDDVLANYHSLMSSLISYGLEDIASSSMVNADERNALCRALERAIATHEPRLKQVHALIHNREYGVNKLSFTIHALMVLETLSEPVNFDAELNTSSLHYAIRNT